MIRTVFQNGMESKLSTRHIGHFVYVEFPSNCNPQICNGALCKNSQTDSTVEIQLSSKLVKLFAVELFMTERTKSVRAFFGR